MYIPPWILIPCVIIFASSLIYAFGHPCFSLLLNSRVARLPLARRILGAVQARLSTKGVRIPVPRILSAKNTIAVVNSQLTHITGKIEGSTTDAILRFAKVLENIEDLERAIQSTGAIIDDIQQKLALNVHKDGQGGGAKIDMTFIRRRYEMLLREIADELSLVVNRKSEDLEKMNLVKESVKSIHTLSDEIKMIARQTKILAVNASIEAANAGKYGTTFAVVAEAIRRVAVQSEESSRKILSQMTITNEILDRNINQIEEAMDVESRFINSTIVVLKDVFLSVIDSLFQLSHRIGVIVDGMMSETSPMKQEVQSLVVNLQFEDMTKQISQHVVTMLEEISRGLTGALNHSEEKCDAKTSKEDLFHRFNQVATMQSERDIAAGLLHGGNMKSESPEEAAGAPDGGVELWDDAPSETAASDDSAAMEMALCPSANEPAEALSADAAEKNDPDRLTSDPDADVTFF